MNILDEINAKLDAVLAALEGTAAAPEPAKKSRGKKVADETPELPGGLVITPVDVQLPLPIEDPAIVCQTIKSRLDMIAPAGSQHRALLSQYCGDWFKNNGVDQDSVKMEQVEPLVAYCQEKLDESLQQPAATTGGL